MAKMIRCKACGYVAVEGKIKDVCPACGVPAKMFEPYTDPVSEKRRRILNLHTHRIIVHFPQAFASLLFALAILCFAVPAQIKEAFHYTIQIISFFLPLAIITSLLSGLLDAKLRFKRLTTPFLKMKIFVGIIFLLVSVAVATAGLTWQLSTTTELVYFTLLTTAAVACTVPLGFIGSKLMEAIFPG